MAIKLVIDNLVEVPGTLRDEYKQGSDGKFHLTLDGEPPKLSEFRDRNIDLMKERDVLKAQTDADKTKLAELLAKPDATKQAADLEAQLAAERAAHAATQLKHIVSSEFLYAGGRASAIDFIAAAAGKVFAMEDGAVVTKEFSAANPSESLSVKEWINKQIQVADFAFQPSSGGGARSSTMPATAFGARSSQKVLKNPSPQDLGANASAIAKGAIKVEYSDR